MPNGPPVFTPRTLSPLPSPVKLKTKTIYTCITYATPQFLSLIHFSDKYPGLSPVSVQDCSCKYYIRSSKLSILKPLSRTQIWQDSRRLFFLRVSTTCFAPVCINEVSPIQSPGRITSVYVLRIARSSPTTPVHILYDIWPPLCSGGILKGYQSIRVSLHIDHLSAYWKGSLGRSHGRYAISVPR